MQEVQVSRGLKRFVVLFVLLATAGIFVHRWIQQAVNDYWISIQSQLQNQGAEVSSPPEVVFSRYGLPTFGGFIAEASWKKKHACKEIRIKAQDIFVPIPFLELLFSHPRAGAINIHHLTLENATEAICEGGPIAKNIPQEAEEESVPEIISEKPLVAKEQFLKIFADLKKIKSELPFSQIDIDNIELKNFDVAGKILDGIGYGMLRPGKELRLEVGFNPLNVHKDKKSIQTKMLSEAKLTEKGIEGRIDWSYHEGHLVSQMQYDEVGKVDVLFQLSNLPLSAVNHWLGTPWTFQFLWADCALHLNSSLEQIEKSFWEASGCHMSGPSGTIKIKNAKVQSLKDPQNLNIDISVERVNIDEVVKGVSALPLAGVFNKFGIISGDIGFRDDQIHSLFTIDGSQILFSKNNKRTVQEIANMDIAVSYAHKKWDMELKKAALVKGKFEGFLSASFNKQTKEWIGNIYAPNLDLSPDVQQIMLGGSLSNLELYGSVKASGVGDLMALNLKGNFKQLELDHLIAAGGSLLMDKNEEGVRLTTTLAHIDISRGVKYDWLFASLLDKSFDAQQISLSRVHAEGLAVSNRMFLKKMSATSLNGKLSIKGELSRNVHSGELEWAFPKRHLLWSWRQESGQVSLKPESDEVREWLQLNTNFIEEFKGVRVLTTTENEAA